MLIKKPSDIKPSEITPKDLYLNRRRFLTGAAIAGAAAVAAVGVRELRAPSVVAQANTKIDGIQKSQFSTDEKITPYKDVTNYNNYYEFSTDKYEPAGLAQHLKTRPWTVTIDGHVKRNRFSMSTPSSRWLHQRSASTGIVAWKGGQSLCPGWGSRLAN